MYKVRVTSLDRGELMLERNVWISHLGNDRCEYYADIRWLQTQAEAEEKQPLTSNETYVLKSSRRVVPQVRNES
jgi:hypothetical protein